ncbi:uncharacterized protein MONBRDRAFT_38203 [Monosiga brevicollis MX1]|uniref:ADF-H domain-containing protein n=1 Tax=Monosiga brevicollis TaxID=81824 RepID=A9V698_MONBE|nr:uncharacterized protein MONBRDRAFT_38203 [Monosiga brevicollis MX1]EDQ87031.1 predicted protein [Monosiga brevicollis MX1]|eukprot:XP_001748270.1 hypothetical protein [Monosiga brevicollis MX1]
MAPSKRRGPRRERTQTRVRSRGQQRRRQQESSEPQQEFQQSPELQQESQLSEAAPVPADRALHSAEHRQLNMIKALERELLGGPAQNTASAADPVNQVTLQSTELAELQSAEGSEQIDASNRLHALIEIAQPHLAPDQSPAQLYAQLKARAGEVGAIDAGRRRILLVEPLIDHQLFVNISLDPKTKNRVTKCGICGAILNKEITTHFAMHCTVAEGINDHSFACYHLEVMYDAYTDVRNDDTETNWVTFGYQDKLITVSNQGSDYNDFLAEMKDDERVYGFVRFETGDELSKRAKFVLVTWVGPNVGALKKAKVSTDKAFVKQVVQSYAKEVLADTLEELDYDTVLDQVKAAGGANYGTGVRH